MTPVLFCALRRCYSVYMNTPTPPTAAWKTVLWSAAVSSTIVLGLGQLFLWAVAR